MVLRLQIMTWLTRNPAFETVSKKRRQSLTTVKNDEEVDVDRLDFSYYTDVWISGDKLRISGPVCDHEDKKLYALLLKQLSYAHGKEKSGLTLDTSYSQLLKLQDLHLSGKNIRIMKRQLDRLNRMSLSFTSSQGNKWSGSLLTEVIQSGLGPNKRVMISFSHFMISFYQVQSYTTFNKNLSEKLMGDGSAFYLFFVSHTKNTPLRPIPFEKCKKLLAMPSEISRKSALRRISNATKDLISFGVLDPKGTFFKNDSLHAKAGQNLHS